MNGERHKWGRGQRDSRKKAHTRRWRIEEKRAGQDRNAKKRLTLPNPPPPQGALERKLFYFYRYVSQNGNSMSLSKFRSRNIDVYYSLFKRQFSKFNSCQLILHGSLGTVTAECMLKVYAPFSYCYAIELGCSNARFKNEFSTSLTF